MSIEPNNEAALDFLERWQPGGPWVLSAITVDKKSMLTATFSDRGHTRAWLEEHNGRRNIYFMVNPAPRPLSKKAEKTDVAALAWLHVDIDPRVGEDIAAERERALRLLQEPPGGVPRPTVIIFSGGGYQGFWKLRESHRLDGTEAAAEDAKLWNLQLEVTFGADHCHNVDRIMRLPGTVNLPDARKAKKGRVAELAALVEFDEARAYDLAHFKKAQPIQQPDVGPLGPGPAAPPVHRDVRRLASVDELNEWDVPDRVKVIIVQGRHPDEGPKVGDDSRSAWVFDVVCNLARCNVPDEVMFSVLTDPDFKISESIFEVGKNATKYAWKQITSGKERAKDPVLAEMNQQYAVIGSIGGKCRVIEEELDSVLKRSRLVVQSFGDFRNRFLVPLVQAGTDSKGQPKFAPKGAWWLSHAQRRYYDRVVFAPLVDMPGAYNLWQGFACESRPGDCELFLAHVRENICSGNEEHYAYLMGWLARMVQQPASPGEVAIVLRGGKGTGKSFFANTVGALLGRHFLPISHAGHLVSNFNAHLRDVVLLFGDEAFYAGDKKHESVLKTLVTESWLNIEAKGVDIETVPNFLHIILASDSHWVVPAGANERRYLVLDVSSQRQQDDRYFERIAEQMRAGGREALLHLLQHWDLEAFRVRQAPRTAALQEQKEMTHSPEESWWLTHLEEGVLTRGGDEPWPARVEKQDLISDYVQQMQAWNVQRRGTAVTFGQFLKRVCPGMVTRQVRRGSERPYVYELPPLSECRAAWDRLYGARPWPEHDPDPPRVPPSSPF